MWYDVFSLYHDMSVVIVTTYNLYCVGAGLDCAVFNVPSNTV